MKMNLKGIVLLLWCIIACVLPELLLAQKSLILEDPNTTYSIDSSNFDFIEFTGKSEVMVPGQTLYLRNADVNKEYWCRVKIVNKNATTSEWFLISYFYSPDEIDIFLKDSTGKIEKQFYRDTMNLYFREVPNKQPSFNLLIKPFETKTLYIKIKNESTYQYSFGVFSHVHFITTYFTEYFLVGLFYGLMLFIFIYCLINYIFFRDKVVLTYLFFITAQVLHMLFRDGNGLYLFPAYTEYVDLFKNLSRASISITILIYTLQFLRIKKSEFAYKFVLVFIIARIGFALYMLENTSVITFHFELFAILISTFLSVKYYVAKEVSAKYIIIGFSLMSIAYFTFYLSIVWLPSIGSIGYFIVYFGVAGESIFTTLALTERFKSIKLESFKKEQMNKELEQKVTQRTELVNIQNKILEEQSSELNSFLYSASHDLKGPLKSIEGLINLGLKDPEVDHKKIYNLMMKQISTLEENISDLHSVTIIKNKGKEIGLLDFEKIHQETIKKYSDQINDSGIAIHLKLSVENILKGDIFPVKLIYQHIVGNAIKFIDSNKKSFLIITISEDDHSYHLSFEDNGVGIKEEILPSIFKMFYRGNESSRNDTGLGLYMVQLSVKKLNGKIEVESS